MGASFEPLQSGSSVAYGACGGIWVMTLHGKPTAPDMLLARPALKSMLQRYPRGFPTLTWVLPEAGFSMESDARTAAADVTREFNASILAMATLVEGQGFQAAAVRAIVSGLDLMSRASAPRKVFSDLAPSVVWCASHRAPRERTADAVEDIAASLATMRAGLTRRVS